MVFYELLTGRVPFYDATYEGTYARIYSAKVVWPLDQSSICMFSGAQELVERMLEFDEAKRISCEDALQHPALFQHQSRCLDQQPKEEDAHS